MSPSIGTTLRVVFKAGLSLSSRWIFATLSRSQFLLLCLNCIPRYRTIFYVTKVPCVGTYTHSSDPRAFNFYNGLTLNPVKRLVSIVMVMDTGNALECGQLG